MSEKDLRKLSKDDLIEQISVFQRISVELIREDHPRELLPLMLRQAMDLLIADGGSLYIYGGNDKLRFEACLNKSFDTDFKPGDLPLESKSVASFCFKSKECVNIDDVYMIPKSLPFSFNSTMDKHMNYRTKSMLAVPLTCKDGRAIGVIQLMNRKNFLEEKWPSENDKAIDMPSFSRADQDTLVRFSELASAVIERLMKKN